MPERENPLKRSQPLQLLPELGWARRLPSRAVRAMFSGQATPRALGERWSPSRRSREARFIFLIVLGSLCLARLLPSGAVRAAEQAPQWRSAEEVRSQLRQEVGVTWSGVTLRGALESVAHTQQVAIFLDRRIDPDAEVTLSRQGVSLRELLDALAEPRQAAVVQIGPLLYFGPQQEGGRLAGIIELKRQAAERLPATVRTRWLRRAPVSWPRLSTPQELIEQLAAGLEVQVQGLDALPHDLWPAYDLPELTGIESLSLVLIGFEKTFEWDDRGTQIRLVPLPDEITLERRYPASRALETRLDELVRKFPGARVERRGTQLLVSGPWELHQQIAELRDPRPASSRPVQGESRYTLRFEGQPLEPALRAIARQLQLEVEFGEGIDEQRQKRVSLELQNATLEELLDALLKPHGLKWQRTGAKIQVEAKED